jgi:hypothetical protein
VWRIQFARIDWRVSWDQLCLQVALTAVKDGMGTLSYVEFVLFPEAMFTTFVNPLTSASNRHIAGCADCSQGRHGHAVVRGVCAVIIQPFVYSLTRRFHCYWPQRRLH